MSRKGKASAVAPMIDTGWRIHHRWENYSLVSMKQNVQLYQTGYCRVLLLKGSVVIDGFSLPPCQWFDVFTSEWNPMRLLSTMTHPSSTTTTTTTTTTGVVGEDNDMNLSKASSNINMNVESNRKMRRGSVSEILKELKIDVALENVLPTNESLEALIVFETLVSSTSSSSSSSTTATAVPMNSLTKNWMVFAENNSRMYDVTPVTGTFVLQTSSYLVLDNHNVAAVGADCFQLKPSWESFGDQLVQHVLRQPPPSSQQQQQPKSLTTTTTVQQQQESKVLFCGPKGSGKSSLLRYSINRLLSVVPQVCVIDCDNGQPEFTAPAMLSLHILDEPLLTPTHLHLRKAELSFYCGEVTGKDDPFLFATVVSKLYEHYLCLYNKQQRHYQQKQQTSTAITLINNVFAALVKAKEINQQQYLFPLLINTNGNTRYMGSEILDHILNTTTPTIIAHLLTKHEPIASVLQFQQQHPTAVVVSFLEVGKEGISKTQASDLRTLRLVSHFVGESVYMRNRLQQEILSFQIRNASLFDPEGSVAQALMSLPVVVVPLSSVEFCLPDEELSPSLLLASFNASLVSISQGTTTTTTTTTSSSISLATAATTTTEEAIQVRYRTVTPCWPSSCLAIVRCIDINNNNAHLIFPSNNETSWKPTKAFKTSSSSSSTTTGTGTASSSSSMSTVLVRSPFGLPLQLSFNPMFPLSTYLTGEASGEGSVQLKPRKNLKRKGSHKYNNNNNNNG